MAYDINEYTTNTEKKIKFDSYNGYLNISNNRFINFIYSGILASIRWYAWKFILLGVFILVIGLVAGKGVNAYKTADEMSDHAASDGWFKAFDQFKKKTDFKQTTANSHPLYNSPIIKSWEEETSLNFSDIYQYIKIKNDQGEVEDLLVMKKAAFDIEDTEKKPLNLEYSTTITDDAEDICDSYFGEIPTNYQKSFYDRKRHWNIRKIKDEITQENDDEGFFRCVISQESITDLMED